ncbi:MAG: hypothetical protein ABI024_01905 [Vicinamibacterales bacterium]
MADEPPTHSAGQKVECADRPVGRPPTTRRCSSIMSMCELAWVLGRGYGYARADLAELIEKILLGRQFEIEKKDLVWAALADFNASQADFGRLIGVTKVMAGCESTLRSLRGVIASVRAGLTDNSR